MVLQKAIKALTLDVAAERDNIAALRHQVANVQADVDAKDKRNEGEEVWPGSFCKETFE